MSEKMKASINSPEQGAQQECIKTGSLGFKGTIFFSICHNIFFRHKKSIKKKIKIG